MLVFLSAVGDRVDQDKFEQLYHMYRQLMFYTANSILHDAGMAEDAVHQAFIRVLDNMGKIGEVDCPQTKNFLVIIVRNIAINIYNDRKRKTTASLDELENWMPDPSAAPADAVEAKEGMMHLASLLEQMPEGYRSVLLLRYDNGYSAAEIANILMLSEENVKKRLQRAKKKLQALLNLEEVSR